VLKIGQCIVMNALANKYYGITTEGKTGTIISIEGDFYVIRFNEDGINVTVRQDTVDPFTGEPQSSDFNNGDKYSLKRDINKYEKGQVGIIHGKSQTQVGMYMMENNKSEIFDKHDLELVED
jgi:hypothetical protein